MFILCFFFFFKQKTAYEMRISDWSSDVCSSDLLPTIDVFYSAIKVAIFAIEVGLIHGYFGYYATGGPAGVGRAVGVAIRITIVVVLPTNLLLSYPFWGTTPTVSLTGRTSPSPPAPWPSPACPPSWSAQRRAPCLPPPAVVPSPTPP